MPERPEQGGLFKRILRSIFGRGRDRAEPTGSHVIANVVPPFSLRDDEHWGVDGKFPLDPRLRVVLSQLQAGNAAQILERAGIDLSSGEESARSLSVFVELAFPLTLAMREQLREACNLFIADAWVRNAAEDPSLRVFPASVKVVMRGVVIDTEALRASVRAIVQDKRVNRLELAPLATASLGPHQGETLKDFNLPADRMIPHGSASHKATGNGVVIGIIDDGCAIAHHNFTSAPQRSRIRYIFDQSKSLPAAAAAGSPWSAPAGPTNYGYGRELVNTPGTGPLDVALATYTSGTGVINEEAIYRALDFPPPNAVSHGTHVMDIAAGNGIGLSGREGVAPEAELIFVQLPPNAVEAGGAAVFRYIADGADYIFNRAKDLEAQRGHAVPAVVNISFANHLGAHDGTSLTEMQLDQLLKFDNRAIVLSAGNGFASGCHASGKLNYTTPALLHWLVSGGDESVNSMEIWYTKAPDVEFYITPPGSAELGPVRAGDPRKGIYNGAGEVIGYIDHVGPAAANGDSQILLTINGTLAYPGSAPLAPAGTWRIRLVKPNPGAPNEYDAWIEHDEARRGSAMHRRQSRFADGEANPTSSISGSACGELTIAVGAYNTATNQVAEYSACGPTRRATKIPARVKPELCAPCASDARGRGVLSGATRFQLSTRMGGTSASAPHVAGLAALALQLHRDLRGRPMSARHLRDLLEKGAKQVHRRLEPNAHQRADANQPRKQSDPSIWPHLVGWGRTDALETLKKV